MDESNSEAEGRGETWALGEVVGGGGGTAERTGAGVGRVLGFKGGRAGGRGGGPGGGREGRVAGRGVAKGGRGGREEGPRRVGGRGAGRRRAGARGRGSVLLVHLAVFFNGLRCGAFGTFCYGISRNVIP